MLTKTLPRTRISRRNFSSKFYRTKARWLCRQPQRLWWHILAQKRRTKLRWPTSIAYSMVPLQSCRVWPITFMRSAMTVRMRKPVHWKREFAKIREQTRDVMKETTIQSFLSPSEKSNFYHNHTYLVWFIFCHSRINSEAMKNLSISAFWYWILTGVYAQTNRQCRNGI